MKIFDTIEIEGKPTDQVALIASPEEIRALNKLLGKVSQHDLFNRYDMTREQYNCVWCIYEVINDLTHNEALTVTTNPEPTCTWTDKRDHWSTECGASQMDPAIWGPYCPFCGKKIKEEE